MACGLARRLTGLLGALAWRSGFVHGRVNHTGRRRAAEEPRLNRRSNRIGIKSRTADGFMFYESRSV
jgi:hypothetical protein